MTTWTDEMLATIKDLWAKKVPASKIAAALPYGITRNAVIGKAHRLGLSSRGQGRPKKPLKSTGEFAIKKRVDNPIGPRRAVSVPIKKLPPIKPREVKPTEAETVPNDRWGCQYIEADTDLANAPRCGKPHVIVDEKDSSWCAHHHALCFAGFPEIKRRRRGEPRMQSEFFW